MNSIEDQLNRIESGGWEAFFDEDLKDPAFAKDLHIKASAKGMSDLDYANEQEALDQLYELDSDAWWLEDQDLSEFIVDEDGNPNVNDAREIFDNLMSGEWTGAYNTSCKDDPEGALIETIEGYETCLSDANIPLGGFADGCGGGVKHALDFLAQFKDNPICKHCKIYFNAIADYARQLNAIAQEYGLNDYIITIPGGEDGSLHEKKVREERILKHGVGRDNGEIWHAQGGPMFKAASIVESLLAGSGLGFTRDVMEFFVNGPDFKARIDLYNKQYDYVIEVQQGGNETTDRWQGIGYEDFIKDFSEFTDEFIPKATLSEGKKRVKEMARTYKDGEEIKRDGFDNAKAKKLFKRYCKEILGAELVRDQDLTVAFAIDRRNRYFVQLQLATNYSNTEYTLETYKKGRLTDAWDGNTIEEFMTDLKDFVDSTTQSKVAQAQANRVQEMAGRRLSSYSDIEIALEFVGQYCAVFDMGKMGFSSNARAYKLLEECEKRFGNFRNTTCFDKNDIDMCTILVSKFEEMNEANDCGNSIGAIYRAANKTWGPYKDWVRANWNGIVNLDPALVDECWEAQRKIYNK